MIKKRGQVTLFIIMFFVLVIAAIFIVSLGKESSRSRIVTEKEKVLSVDDINVRNFAENCVTVTAKKALFYLGFIGGDLKPDPFKIYYSYDEYYKIPYFYIEGDNNIPVPYYEDYWENLLDQYIELNFENCINNFESFEGIKIKHGKATSNTEFSYESVIFNVDFPVTIARNFRTNNLDPMYITSIKVRLRDILKFVTTIVEQEFKNDVYIHWDYLTEVSSNNYNITVYTENNNTIIYRIIDLENNIDNEPYLFQFANKIITQRYKVVN